MPAWPRGALPEWIERRIRVSRALVLAAVLAASIPACGGEDEPDSPPTSPDGGDGPGIRDDSNSIETYGRAADAASEAAIASAVTSFFAANAAGDVAEACRLLSSAARQQLNQTLGQSPELRGRGCRAVLARLFELQPPEYRAGVKDIKVTGARLQGDRGFALLEARAIPGDAIPIRREGGAWKLAAVEATLLPR
jgi:hypothetical protein